MPRPPSAHGLERKFKPWRKGKGRRAPSQDGETEVRVESRGSLKNRLRSQRRLLAKLKSTTVEKGNTEGESMSANAEKRIEEFEELIKEKEMKEKEKAITLKYRTVRFYERRKLMRMENTALRGLEEGKKAGNKHTIETKTKELRNITRDMAYVAHFPKGRKYVSLFSSNGNNDNASRIQNEVRDEIIAKLQRKEIEVPRSWSAQEHGSSRVSYTDFEENTEDEKNNIKVDKASNSDSDSDSSSMPSESSDDEISEDEKLVKKVDKSSCGISDGSSSESSDSDSSDTSSSSSSMDSDCDDSDSDKLKTSVSDNKCISNKPDKVENTLVKGEITSSTKNESNKQSDNESDSEDSFLVCDNDNNSDEKNSFSNPSIRLVKYDGKNQGDKSKGWSTQNQKPGEWNRRHLNRR